MDAKPSVYDIIGLWVDDCDRDTQRRVDFEVNNRRVYTIGSGSMSFIIERLANSSNRETSKWLARWVCQDYTQW